MKHTMDGTPPWVNKVTNKEVDEALAGILEMFEGQRKPAYKPRAVEATTEDKYVLKIVAPGSSKESFVVEVKSRKVFIEHKAKQETILNRSFKFSYDLPEGLYTNHTSAEYVDGILTIYFPKEKPKKVSVY